MKSVKEEINNTLHLKSLQHL